MSLQLLYTEIVIKKGAIMKQAKRKDNSISFRIATQDKIELHKAAAFDKMKLSEWLLKLAYKRINEQKQGKQESRQI